MINKSVNQGGPAEYQHLIREEALSYVKDFSLCLDIGANVGLWSKPLSKHFSKVISFEPVDFIYECLLKNTDRTIVEAHQCALGDVDSTVDIIVDEHQAGNTGHNVVDPNSIGTGSIPIKRLDDLDIAQMGMIKLDCEGYEINVLKGGSDTILKYKPIIVIESELKPTDADSLNWLRDHGAKELCKIRKDYVFGW
jgi:FkbM family methyltransferase